MARKRMLKPEFFTSATMNALPIQAMLTFAGIWCWADDSGRGEDDETLVKAFVWPRRRTMSESKVRADMNALADAGVLCRYTVNGVALLHVVSWREHQSISHPTKSKLPPCEMHEPEEWCAFLNDTDPALHKFRNDSGGIPECVSTGSNVVQLSAVQVSQDQSAERRTARSGSRNGLGL